MEYDFVAVEWRTGDPKQDTTFMEERREMLDRGWTVHLRALWPAERMPRRLAGGICIMRRPKDQPRKDEDARVDEWYRLYHERYGVEPPCCFFLPRLDEPRMWTKAEIEEIVRTTPVVTYAEE